MKTWGKVLIGVIGIAVLVVAWWLISPLFLNETVDEGLPPTSEESRVEDTEEESDVSEADAAEEGTVKTTAVSGVFKDGEKNYQTAGTIQSVESDGNVYLRFEDFETTNGPDLFVYLTKPGQETTEGVSLGALKGNIGNQNYLVPEEVDLEEYSTVVIWCRAFSATFGTGELTANNE
ncbi:DM13 domain-containing protein [Exiguobacterium algae]|uniref:DM13 domain-containing protein n=1 Tax=Exiguobacterium algae TaxID=2751250 RepID=UPI001BE7DFC1|nr:DM13 domain-containing protein [Exiguobacterium algae]